MAAELSPTIQRLRCFPKDNKRRNYPKGTRQPLTKELAQRFCDLIATSTRSTASVLADNPGFPPFKTLETWRYKHAWFGEMWNHARKRQAEHLMQVCLDETHAVTGKTAHAVRVKFDVYRFLASKFHPEVYGDKSQHGQQQTTVNVGVSISPERLTDIRSKLDQTRIAFLPKPAVNAHEKDELPVTLQNGNNHD